MSKTRPGPGQGQAVTDGAHRRRRCLGWPEGHACLVLTSGGQWCQGCLLRRQEAMAAGVPSGVMPVAVILEDFEAPRLQCRCGGDPEGPNHEASLLHLKWSYATRLTTTSPEDRA